MTSPRTPAVAVALLAANVALSPAHIAYATCTVAETGGASADAAWHAAVETLRRELAGDDCGGVALAVELSRGGARIVARAPDGRETTRFVANPLALSAVAFGLIAVAPTEPARAADALEVPTRDAEPPPHARPPSEDFPSHLSVSVAAGARGGFPTDVVMADVEVRVDLFVHSWLVSLAMRGTPFASCSRFRDDLDAYAESGLALQLGRRLTRGRSTVDLTAGPNLTYIWIENDAAGIDAEHAQFRLATLARYGFAASAHVRLNATVDGELAPSGLSHPSFEMGLAPYPAFTVGLRLGAELTL